MKEGLFSKGLVLAIICCFIGAGVVPCISVKLKDGNDQRVKDVISTSSTIVEYGINKEETKSIVTKSFDKGIQSNSATNYNTISNNNGKKGEKNILNRDGDWQWAKQAGGTSSDRGEGVSVDSSGNSYITGYFYGSALFGTTTLVNQGYQDVFVAKLDTNGNWQWATQAGGTSYDSGYGVSVDSSGNSYITGFFMGSALFGTTTLVNQGYQDVFVAKLDTNGNWQWAKQAGGTSSDSGLGVSVDSSGNSYITGYFYGSASFGTTTLVSQGGDDVFVAKLDTDGNWQWAKQAGGTSSDRGLGVSVDGSGNCYITGRFWGSASFGTTTLVGQDVDDVFVAKLDTDGNWQWAKQAGGTSSDYGRDIPVDGSGNCYITGVFKGSALFGTTTLVSQGSYDVFVAKLSDDGGNQPPNPPTNPNPYDGATNIDLVTTISVEISDTDGNQMDVTFYDANTDIIIGMDYGIPSGRTATVSWSGLDYETTYSWYVIVDDGLESTQSDVYSFTTKPNLRPVIEIVNLHDGDTVRGIVTIIGVANDFDGEISLVEVKIDSGIWETAHFYDFFGVSFWYYEWDTSNIQNNKCLIQARSYDGYLYSSEYSINVKVKKGISEPYYFIHLTDPHALYRKRIYTPDGLLTYQNEWKKIINHIKELSNPPKFVICSGDIVEWGADINEDWPTGTLNYQKYLKPLKKEDNKLYIVSESGVDIPLYCCPGNHDYRDLEINPFSENIENYINYICNENHDGWLDYIVTDFFPDLAIISMNSGWDVFKCGLDLLPEGNGLNDLQMEWLCGQLEALNKNSIDNIVIFMHHPCVNGYQEDDIRDGTFWNNNGIDDGDFRDVCKDYSVDLVLCGHDHKASSKFGGIWDENGDEWDWWDGTKFVITDSVKGNLAYRSIIVSNDGLDVRPVVRLK